MNMTSSRPSRSSIGFTLLPDLRSVWIGCGSAGLCDLQPESIVLREFEVSGYMASALVRLEEYRGNATQHGF